ncbi:MAG: DUF1957 domain-containing protein [Pyrinomonadaceae bacterium]|nr:DUF1957 domain-containing protein [Pyrinomonadaceae bacterium]
MPTGFFSLILHAHLPFVPYPEHPHLREEETLYQAITEAYLPLIDVISNLHKSGVAPRITIGVSPLLCEMLADPLRQSLYTGHLENLLSLTEQEIKRTEREAPEFVSAAKMYHEKLNAAWRLWSNQLNHNILPTLGELQTADMVEIITSSATHAVLPLISTVEARRAQVEVAVANYRKHFKQTPRGIWLPGCAYEMGIEELLADVGIEYFVTDAQAILYGDPRPRYGIYAPVRCPNGVAVFARDPQTSQQVESSVIGYPSHAAYRDLSTEAPLERLHTHLRGNGERRPLDLKYHRITGRDVPLADKHPYDPEAARQQTAIHADRFIGEHTKQIERLRDSLNGRAPLVVAPYPAELFGHWWFEGIQFLDTVFRQLHLNQQAVAAISLGDYLRSNAAIQIQQPSSSSCCAEGYFKVWLNEDNAWISPHQQAAEIRMIKLANNYHEPPNEQARRALNQAARELLLVQSSDWAFQLYQGVMPEHATHPFHSHIRSFHWLADAVEHSAINEDRLSEIEQRDSLFAELDYRIFKSKQ